MDMGVHDSKIKKDCGREFIFKTLNVVESVRL